jgi:hypothetical protein
MNAFSALRAVALGQVIAIISLPAEAQICNGAAPFSSGFVRLGVGAGRFGSGFGGADSNPSGGLRLSLGAKQGPFASVSASAVLYSPYSSNPFIREGLAKDTFDDAGGGNIGFSGGYGISVSASPKIEVCPMAGLTNQSGPSLAVCHPLPGGGKSCAGAGRGSGRAFWYGGGTGVLSEPSPKLALAPFASALVVSSKISANGRNVTDNYFEVTGGLGLMYRRLAIRPTLSYPIGLDEGSASFGLEFAVNLGPKK